MAGAGRSGKISARLCGRPLQPGLLKILFLRADSRYSIPVSLLTPNGTRPALKLPILNVVYASYVFLWRHLRFAVKAGWPFFLTLLLLVCSILLGQIEALAASAEHRPSNAALFIVYIPFFLVLVAKYFEHALCISWLRGLVRGFGRSAYCHPIRDNALIISSLPYSLFSFAMIKRLFMPLFLDFVAVANNHPPVKDSEAYRAFKGMKSQFAEALMLCYLPPLVLFGASILFWPYSLILIPLIVSIMPFLRSAVLGAYYIEFKKNPDWPDKIERLSYPTTLDF